MKEFSFNRGVMNRLESIYGKDVTPMINSLINEGLSKDQVFHILTEGKGAGSTHGSGKHDGDLREGLVIRKKSVRPKWGHFKRK